MPLPPANLKDVEINNAKMQEHQHLKVVEIVGYDGSASITMLALCLSHHMHAPMLNKIILNLQYPQLNGYDRHDIIGVARLQAKLLAKQIRYGVDVVIL